jgi:hypothetical protein
MVIKIRIRIRIFLSRISDTSDYWIRIREDQNMWIRILTLIRIRNTAYLNFYTILLNPEIRCLDEDLPGEAREGHHEQVLQVPHV